MTRQQLFAISRRNAENCIADPRRGKSSITWRYGDDRSTHLVMLHDGSGLSLGGHIQSRRVRLSFPRGAATVFPSLFPRPVPIPQLFPVSLVVLSAYRGFPFWLGRHSTRTPESTNNLAKQKRSPMFFYSFHFFRSICRSCPCRWFNRETITRIVHTRIRCTKKERTYFTREML